MTPRLTLACALFFPLVVPAAARAEPDPRVPELYRASYQLEANRNSAGALAKMREVRAITGGTYFVTVRIAWLSYVLGDHGGAVQAYRQAAALEPKAVEPRLGLTLPLLAQRRWRDLERASRDVLALDPHHALARARLAHALYSVGNYPDAAALYRKLVVEYPADLDAQTGLGWALLRMGRRADARRLFEAVLAVSPDNANAKQGLAQP